MSRNVTISWLLRLSWDHHYSQVGYAHCIVVTTYLSHNFFCRSKEQQQERRSLPEWNENCIKIMMRAVWEMWIYLTLCKKIAHGACNNGAEYYARNETKLQFEMILFFSQSSTFSDVFFDLLCSQDYFWLLFTQVEKINVSVIVAHKRFPIKWTQETVFLSTFPFSHFWSTEGTKLNFFCDEKKRKRKKSNMDLSPSDKSIFTHWTKIKFMTLQLQKKCGLPIVEEKY